MRRSKSVILLILLLLAFLFPLLLSSTQAATYSYVASKSSKVYHMVECGQAAKILESNRVYFSSRSEAEASGRRPCSYCGDGIVDEGNDSGGSGSSSGSSSSGSTSSGTTIKKPSTNTDAPKSQNSLVFLICLALILFAFLIMVIISKRDMIKKGICWIIDKSRNGIQRIIYGNGCLTRLFAMILVMAVFALLAVFFGYLFSVNGILGFIVLFGCLGIPFYYFSSSKLAFWFYVLIVAFVFFGIVLRQ